MCDSLDIGGAERHVVSLATTLTKRGHDVTIACSRAGLLAVDARAAGVGILTLTEGLAKRRVSLAYTRALVDLVRGAGFDLVHAHMHASAAAAAVACARSGVPLVITEHSEAMWRDARAWRTARSAYRRAAHVIAVSDAIRRHLVKSDRVPRHRTTSIRNAITRSDRPSLDADPLRRRDSPGDPIIGVVARLVPEKGVAHFLGSAVAVLRDVPRARFVVIGDGPLRDELVRTAEALGIATRVWFLGARVDGPQLIGELDVLAVPSIGNEGTPLVTLEALAAGVPIVASAVGGIPEQLRGFDRAVIVRPGDHEALARGIVAMTRARAATARGHEMSVLPGHEAMVRATEGIYFKAYASTGRSTGFYPAALAARWLPF